MEKKGEKVGASEEGREGGREGALTELTRLRALIAGSEGKGEGNRKSPSLQCKNVASNEQEGVSQF